MDISRWGYSYTRATGGELVDSPLVAMSVATHEASSVEQSDFAVSSPGIAALALNESVAKTLVAPPSQVRHIAHVTFIPPADVRGVEFNLFVAPEGS